jgi:hypothetical protein
MSLVLAACTVSHSHAQESVDLMGTTASGIEFIIGSYPQNAVSIDVWLKGKPSSPADPVVRMAGFARLRSLEEVSFLVTPTIQRYDDVAEASGLKRLLFAHAYVRDFAFLAGLRHLRVLKLETCGVWRTLSDPTVRPQFIDLGKNPDLEYLGFPYCSLQSFPMLRNVPSGLRYLDLTGNGMVVGDRDVPALEAARSIGTVFLWGNTVPEPIRNRYPNLTLQSPVHVLPRYFDRSGEDS